jgi:predicted TIM-barrel fold metal-dependent hydrolase
MIKVDAHQHYWNPARGDYDWMPKDHPVLTKVYGPSDLAPLIERHGIRVGRGRLGRFRKPGPSAAT